MYRNEKTENIIPGFMQALCKVYDEKKKEEKTTAV